MQGGKVVDFLRPSLLWGLAALSLPILIHLLGSRRRRVVHVGTLRFIERARARAAAKWRLRRFMLLLARLLSLLFLVALFAGPGIVVESAGGLVKRVVLFDTSPSMGQVIEGERGVKRGKALVGDYLEALPEGSLIALITTAKDSPGEEVFLSPGVAAGLLMELDTEADDAGIVPAIERASALLSSEGGGEIIVVTDMQKNSWRAVESLREAPYPVKLVDVGGGGLNRWVASVAQQGERIRVTLGASGGDLFDEVMVTLTNPGKETLTSFSERGEVNFTPSMDAPLSILNINVDPGGALEEDDTLEFLASADPVINLLLVNGDPSEFRLMDETLFLRQLLSSGGRVQSRFATRTVRLSSLSSDDIGKADVVWLANPGDMEVSLANAILKRVEEGMGLIISAGENLDPEGGTGALAKLLAAPLRDSVILGGEDVTRAPYEEVDLQSFAAPFEDFSKGELALVGEARTRGYWLTDSALSEGVRVLARFSNQAPLLVERRTGSGRLMLLTTTIDRDWSDLCLRPSFLPLIERALLYVTGNLRSEALPYMVIGLDELKPSVEVFDVEAPSGLSVTLRPDSPPFKPVEAGAHRLISSGRWAGGFVARFDPGESNLTRLFSEELKALGEKSGVTFSPLGSSPGSGRRDLSSLLALLLIVAVLAEALLSGRWSRMKGSPSMDVKGVFSRER
ncbi:MAG: hypothetical protein C0608_05950 [Deltaproteobacteria bacterium]|nr:MAG: hypothetical protein C0608_05950 [Deltaproteobacteria bacterium]